MKKILTTSLLLAAFLGCKGMIKTSTSTSGLGGGGGGGGGGGDSAGSPSSSGEATVPDLIGKTEEEAIAAVRAAGFSTDAESNYPLECEDPQQIEGKVNCQEPEAGKTVKAYTMVHIHVYKKQVISGAVVRDQLLALIGKTPDAAKKLLDSYGHDGRVKVEPDTKFHDGCGDNRVCSFSVAESGMGIHDEITLYTNPKLTISGPPPE